MEAKEYNITSCHVYLETSLLSEIKDCHLLVGKVSELAVNNLVSCDD